MTQITARQAYRVRMDAYLEATEALRLALWLYADTIAAEHPLLPYQLRKVRGHLAWERYCSHQLARSRGNVSDPRGMFAA